jgi:hypothetical protein
VKTLTGLIPIDYSAVLEVPYFSEVVVHGLDLVIEMTFLSFEGIHFTSILDVRFIKSLHQVVRML